MKMLSAQAFEKLKRVSEVVASDGTGVKVLRTGKDRYLKLFRVKRIFSSARIYPYWRRFIKHVTGLKRRGIPTVEVIGTVRVPSEGKTGVFYRALEGRTVREIAESGELDENLVSRLGGFFAELHSKGIYFRSIHLGNIVLAPDGRFGLIDVSDMRMYHLWPLRRNVRLRNFSHLFRYREDLSSLVAVGETAFVEGYLKKLPRRTAKMMKPRLIALQERWLKE